MQAADLPRHPRLIATNDQFPTIDDRCRSDPLMARLRRIVLDTADRAHAKRPCAYLIPDGRRLLHESRRALDTVLHTAMAWKLTGDRRHVDRCVVELDAACGLPDWHPPHFLDTAEMATAVAIGLDWLHDELDPDQRARYRQALLDKAIRPARESVEQNAPWTRVRNNWSQVCATGIGMAIVASAVEPKDLDDPLLAECRRIIEASTRFYEPDGCYPEGPSYWDYGTSYQVLGLILLHTLHGEAPLPDALLRGPSFMAHARGPSGTLFNFADAPPRRDRVVAARGWLAARCDDPAIVADLRDQLESLAPALEIEGTNDRFFPLHLLWLPGPPNAAAVLPLAAAFRGEQPMAAFRTSWRDPDALFLAVKGGTPGASHGHMDVGSFVVEWGGRRWIHDLGSDDYNLPGYFSRERWTYFRVNSRSHNVPMIDGALQNPACVPCPLVAEVDAQPFRAHVDLSSAYQLRDQTLATTVTRDIAFDASRRTIHVRDLFTDAAGSVRWQVLVDVKPVIDGHRAVLRDGARAIELTILAETSDHASIAWQVEAATPPTPRERSNDGFHLLSFTLPSAERVVADVAIHPRDSEAEPSR